jgi:hypothetical protein
MVRHRWEVLVSRSWFRRSALVVLGVSSSLVFGCSPEKPSSNDDQQSGQSADGATSEGVDAPGDSGTHIPQPDGDDTSSGGPVSASSRETETSTIDTVSNAASPSNKATKLDLLLVVDNSANMPEKAALFGDNVRSLLSSLVQPPCVDAAGATQARTSDGCPSGTSPLHAPVEDIHVGVITTSLGAYGAERNCVVDPTIPDTLQKDDGAHLMGSLSRGQGLTGGDFLTWQAASDQNFQTFEAEVQAHISAAGEFGCGYEGQLETWVRFLVDPSPYTRIVRQPCNVNDSGRACNGPERDANGLPLVDETLLAQRAAFLRPDSLVGIVVLTDENDCSMSNTGQTWIITDRMDTSGTFRGSAACEADPNDACCMSCGASAVSPECPTEENGAPLGCTELTYPFWTPDAPTEDSLNLRCFHQKRRFGYDFLFPVDRYVSALTQTQICPENKTLAACSSPVDNPLWVNAGTVRPAGRVFFATIAGVPWQDLAVDVDAEVLTLRPPSATEDNDGLNWDLLLGARDANSYRRQYPLSDGVMDPLLFESVAPRTGVHPPTNSPLAPPESAPLANPVNGHEWNVLDQASLQFSCILPLAVPETCLSAAEQAEQGADGTPIHACECGAYGNDDYRSPVCQNSDGSYGLTKRFSAAFPPTRLLQVQEGLTAHDSVTGVVGSVCAKSVNASDADYGYKPTMDALLEGFRRHLE